MVATRTNAAHVERTDAIGTTYVELLAVGRTDSVAVCPYHAHIDVSDELAMFGQLPRLAIVGLHLQELRIRVLEHCFLLISPLLAERHITKRKKVGSLAQRHLPEDWVMKSGWRLVRERVAHLRHKLVAHRHKQIRTLVHQFGESRCHVLHVFVLNDEWRELMMHKHS